MDNTGASFQIYYRMSPTVTNMSPRDHIVKDGEALCNYGVNVPDDDCLKPISEVTDSEWAVHLSRSSNLCDECSEGAEYHDLFPDDLPEQYPQFRCPVCQETADSVSLVNETARVLHRSDCHSFPKSSETHKIPRERFDVWRTNPEEEFSYPKLKEFIDNYPHVFRREEYQQAKREEVLQKMDWNTN